MQGKGRKKIKVIKTMLFLTMIVCLIPVIQAYYLSVRHEKQQESLQRQRKEHVMPKSGISSETSGILEQYRELYQENKDLAGWLRIEGLNIDNPVMQCVDDEYYLSHNFYKEEDKYGCLYVRNMADIHTPGTNFIIYGHNMRDGSMFGSLKNYEKETFYKEHREIFFDTLFEERVYEIAAVFSENIYEENAFPYYQFYQADTESEFRDFYENVKKHAFYDTGVTAEWGDTFLTLSTCFGQREEERLVIVAKQKKE